MNQKELTKTFMMISNRIKTTHGFYKIHQNIYNNFKLKKPFGLHGLYTNNSALRVNRQDVTAV